MEKVKLTVEEGGRVHTTKEVQACWWSTQMLFEGMNLSELSQPGDVFFPTPFSCSGAGWRGHNGRVLPDEHDGREEPGNWYMQGTDYSDRS